MQLLHLQRGAGKMKWFKEGVINHHSTSWQENDAFAFKKEHLGRITVVKRTGWLATRKSPLWWSWIFPPLGFLALQRQNKTLKCFAWKHAITFHTLFVTLLLTDLSAGSKEASGGGGQLVWFWRKGGHLGSLSDSVTPHLAHEALSTPIAAWEVSATKTSLEQCGQLGQPFKGMESQEVAACLWSGYQQGCSTKGTCTWQIDTDFLGH